MRTILDPFHTGLPSWSSGKTREKISRPQPLNWHITGPYDADVMIHANIEAVPAKSLENKRVSRAILTEDFAIRNVPE